MQHSNINYNLYRTFVEVYETKSFSKAAKNLVCTQPAVSAAVKELEAQLDTKLFLTNTRGCEPTTAAAELYKTVQPALLCLNRGEDAVKEINGLAAGEISFSCPSHVACFILSDFFCDFRMRYPNIKLKIRSVDKDETIAMLKNRNLEFAIHILPFENDTFEIVNLLTLPYVFYTSKAYAEKNNIGTSITKSILEKYPVIVPAKSSRNIRAMLDGLNTNVNIMIESATSELGCCLVLKNCGIGHALEIFLDNNERRDEIVKLSVKDASLPKATLAYAYHKNLVSKAGQVFLKELEKFCRTLF